MTTVPELFAGAGPIVVVEAGGETTLRPEDLDRLAGRCARALERLGIGAGDRVGVWLPNGPGYLAALLACGRLGTVAVAVNTRFRAAEVGDVVSRSGCRVLLWAPGFLGIDFAGILAAVDRSARRRLEHVVAVDDVLAGGPVSATDRAHEEAPYAVFTTSGTTRAPKLVLHRQASVTDHALDVARAFELTPDSVTLVPMPLCGVFGFSLLTGALAGGGPVVLAVTADPGLCAAAIARHRVTDLAASDDLIARLLDRGEDLSSVRRAGYAAFNPSLADLPERADEQGLAVTGLFGMSEVQALFAHRSPALPLAERRRPGGALVSPRAAIRIDGPGDPPEGELLARGPSLFAGYLADGGDRIDETLTAAHFTDDGYFRTGDLARAEPGGGFEYLARLGDALRLGGFLVNPAEIEAELLEHPAVADAQVVGVDGADGAAAVAFVTGPEAAFDEEALRAHCAARLARYKVPARVVHLASFPTTPSANGTKIRRAELRRMASAVVGTDPAGARSPEHDHDPAR